MTKRIKYIIFLLLLLIGEIAHAQTCCSGGVPVTGNIGLPPGQTKSLQISVSHDLNVLKTLKFGTETLGDKSRTRITNSYILELGYAFSNRFSADVFFSYVKQVREIDRFGRVNRSVISGVGDAVLLLKYRVTPISNAKRTWIIGAGPKFPLGASDLKSNGFEEGADLQPGSGAWDLILWSSYSQKIPLRPSMNLFSTVAFSTKGKNKSYLGSETFQFSEEIQILVGISDRILVKSQIIDPSLGFRFRKVGHDQLNKHDLPNTGGQWVSIIPSLAFSIHPNLILNISSELPLHSKLEGTQLTPTYKINTGLLFIINTKKKENEFKLKL